MIDPTQDDVGRRVTYRPIVGDVQEGIITSFNDYCVFVRYGASVTSQATFREDLFWNGERNG